MKKVIIVWARNKETGARLVECVCDNAEVANDICRKHNEEEKGMYKYEYDRLMDTVDYIDRSYMKHFVLFRDDLGNKRIKVFENYEEASKFYNKMKKKNRLCGE